MSFEENKRIVAERKRRAEERYREGSRLKLRTEIEKRCRTIMIAALDECEKGIGHLWGHGKDDATEDELLMQDIWLDVRELILDRGNEQAKLALKELDKYDVSYRQRTYEFITKEQKEND